MEDFTRTNFTKEPTTKLALVEYLKKIKPNATNIKFGSMGLSEGILYKEDGYDVFMPTYSLIKSIEEKNFKIKV